MRFRSCVFAGAWPPARWRWIRSGVRRGERWGGSFSRSPRAGQRALARLIFVERAVLVLGPECGPDLLLNAWALVVPRAASQPQSRARQTAPFSGPLPSDSRAVLGVASSRVGAQAVATTEDSNLADQGRPRGEGRPGVVAVAGCWAARGQASREAASASREFRDRRSARSRAVSSAAAGLSRYEGFRSGWQLLLSRRFA